MAGVQKPYTMIEDFVTGQQVPNVGAETNRQAVEKILVLQKGFLKSDIEVDAPIVLSISGVPYTSSIDLVVSVKRGRFMAIKCVAGSIGSREREIVSAARLAGTHIIPLAAVSDGVDAVVLDAVTGKKIGEGLTAFPTRPQAENFMESLDPAMIPAEKQEREKLVFRTYDQENINVRRHMPSD